MAESSPPQLTYIITGLQYGGANIGMARLLSELSADEFDITVVSLVETPPDVVDLLPDHVTVRRLDIRSPVDVHRVSRLTGVMRQTDILVCSLFHATAVGTLLGTLFRVPTMLVWQHNTQYQSPMRRYLFETAYSLADCVLADSENVATMLEDLDVDSDRIAVLPIAGIDTEQYRCFNVEQFDGDVTIVTVGRLTEVKGYPDLFQCACKLGPEFQFHIAGDGPMSDELVANSPDNVTLHGAVPNERVPHFLNRGDIYFQPSLREGLCMTVIEAMACSLPVVASAVGGITESTLQGETGFLCEPGDIECFHDRIEQLGDNPNLRQEMGQNGRERAVERYSAEALADAFRDAVATATHR